MQAVARHMIGRGNGGKIINMASQAGRRGEPLVAVYCASKAAVISLTQSAGLNLISTVLMLMQLHQVLLMECIGMELMPLFTIRRPSFRTKEKNCGRCRTIWAYGQAF